MYGKCECFVKHMMYVCHVCIWWQFSNAAFCMTFSLVMLVEDASHEVLLLFTPPCCGECVLLIIEACVRVLKCCECVLYMWFGSKVRPRTFGCVAMGSAVLFILRSRLLVYSVGSGGINRVQVVLCEIVVFCPGKNCM